MSAISVSIQLPRSIYGDPKEVAKVEPASELAAYTASMSKDDAVQKRL